MAEVADAVEFAKALGPTEETRAQFAKSWLGSSLGQMVVLGGLILSYVLILVLLWTFAAGPLGQMKKAFGDIGFYALIASFPAIVMAFNVIPAALRARRERRLKRLTLTGGVAFEPGYFRLHPYGADDAHRFRRNDGADGTLLDWVRRADEALLYLSGPSGSGKSSLIAAHLEPGLRCEGWAIINTRLYGDPLHQILRAFAPDDAQAPSPDHVYAVIAAKVAAHRQTQQNPLLLIIDQFEEHLILGDAAAQAPLQALLKRLASQPIDGLKTLLSLRSDYQPLIFQQDLPKPRPTLNWFQLAPYRRGDAEAFLQGGGKQMTPEAIDALFKGLDRIEETRGLYRPISLNMVGLVLERMGQTLEGDPETLIQAYLKSALITGDTKDYVRPLLEMMISDAGTKTPRSGNELASKTGLQHWQVNAAMADLETRGLVRPLHGGANGWEIAHDFLARLLGQMLGRVKVPLMTRVRPYAAPVGLALWMAVLGFGVQYGIGKYQTYLRDTLTRNGWMITAIDGGKFSATYGIKLFSCDKDRFQKTFHLLSDINHLDALQTYNCYPFASFEPLRDLKSLTRLGLGGVTDVTSLEPLRDLKLLTNLELLDARGLTNLEPLSNLTSLTILSLSGITGVTDFEPLSKLTSLTDIALFDVIGMKSLRPLQGLLSLNYLNLRGATGVTSLEPLSGLKSLINLEVNGLTGVTNLEPLRDLKSLTSLGVSGLTGVTNLEPLRDLKSLTRLDLSGLTGVTSLESLRDLRLIAYLDLMGATGVTSLEPLRDFKSLSFLDLQGATGLQSLEPLKGHNIDTITATDALLATMR